MYYKVLKILNETTNEYTYEISVYSAPPSNGTYHTDILGAYEEAIMDCCKTKDMLYRKIRSLIEEHDILTKELEKALKISKD